MATFRIEAAADPANGKYFFEVYYPDNSTVPHFKSDSVYFDLASAEYDAIRIFKDVLQKMGKLSP